ncbi:MAG: acyltransferase family protein [Solirubrobacterales bacterium]
MSRDAVKVEEGSTFRPDIQGVRAIAVILVLLCHARLPFAEGGFIGVDVFYVVSGFLITGLIVNEVDREGRLSLRGFYARRAKRILPMAATVVVFVAIVSFFVFSIPRQVAIGGDIFASAFFVLNWHLIAQGVDYFAVKEGLISPLQHYWTLSVEEQFYVVWPILVVAVSSTLTRGGRHLKRNLLFVIVPLAAASLIYSISYSMTDPESAFLSTFARGWELAFGVILALVLPKKIRLPGRLSTVLAVSALIVIVGCTYLLGSSDPFPGWLALFPVLATVALLVAGASQDDGPVPTILSTAPFQYVGNISYSLYLWHWPFVVFAIAIWGDISPAWLVLVTLASTVPAAISSHYIEQPLHRSRSLSLRPRRALALGVACMLVTIGVSLIVTTNRIDVDVLPAEQARGAAALDGGKFPIQTSTDRIRPNPIYASYDRGNLFDDDCLLIGDDTVSPSCTYGNPDSDRKVVAFGDSHALEYFPALEAIAEKEDWRLEGLTRGNCPPSDVDSGEICNSFRSNSIDRIKAERPDLVVIALATVLDLPIQIDGESVTGKARVPYLRQGLVRTINEIKESGAKVAVIGDQTRAPFTPADCVSENLDNLGSCIFRRKKGGARSYDRAAASLTGSTFIDPVPLLCRRNLCPSVIGDVVVYRDDYHLTATYATTLATWLSRSLPTVR